MSVDQTVRAGRLPGNSRYANAGGNFANHALRRLPGLKWLSVAACAATVIMIVTGGFGTGSLPLASRIAFWTLLLGWNLVKWQAWFALLVRKPSDWWKAALAGSLVLNLPLPLEINIALGLIGIDDAVPSGHVWLAALAMSVVLYALLALVRRAARPDPVATAAPAPQIRPNGLLERVGIRSADALLAIVSEDHYCRVHLGDGSSPLVYFRFRDALDEVQSLDGRRVHRGAWVADSAVLAARRVERRWQLELTNGSVIPVSARYVAELRRCGWHRRTAPAATR